MHTKISLSADKEVIGEDQNLNIICFLLKIQFLYQMKQN